MMKSLSDIDLIDDETGDMPADGGESVSDDARRIMNQIDKELAEMDAELAKPVIHNNGTKTTRRMVNYESRTSGDYWIESL
jgi:hypothetical protein